MTRHLFLLLGLAATTACAARPKPDDMSATSHRREAQQERAAARDKLLAYQPERTEILVPQRGENGAPSPEPIIYWNSTAWNLDEAARRTEHAAQHEAAASELERFEEAECARFTPALRQACPVLVGVVEIRELARGVRLRFAPGAPVALIAAHMRCHHAFARARGYSPDVTCPLYQKGLRIEVVDEGRAIELVGDAPEEIQRRVREIVRPR